MKHSLSSKNKDKLVAWKLVLINQNIIFYSLLSELYKVLLFRYELIKPQLLAKIAQINIGEELCTELVKDQLFS